MSEELDFSVSVTHYNGFPSSISRNSIGNFLYLNARSIRNSLFDIQNFLDTQNFVVHVVVIVETWLKQEETCFFNLKGYAAFHSVRKQSTGGGVAIFVHNSFDNANLILESDFDSNNILIISLLKQKCKIVAIYRQPNNSSDPNASSFIAYFEQILSKHTNCYIFGDFNINLLSSSEMTYRYQNSYSLNGFVLLNNLSKDFPTRINRTHNSVSCIDHVLTDVQLFDDKISFSMYLFDLIADHKSILMIVSSDNRKIMKNTLTKSFELVNHAKIKQLKLLENINPSSFDDYVEQVHAIIKNNKKVVELRNKSHKPYISKDILSLIKVRNNYFRLKSRFPHFSYAAENYRTYRNKVASLIKTAKKKYVDEFFQCNANDARKVWDQMKCLLYNSDKKKQTCDLLVDNGIPISNPLNIVERFNEYFTTSVDDLISSISNSLNLEEYHLFHSRESYDVLFPFTCPECTEDEISLIIGNLSNSKAEDIYGMSNFFVKTHKAALVSNLYKLINHAMFSGVFPDSLKLGVVSPIFKSGNQADKSNYRAVTVLPIFSKVFEYVILRRLEDHLSCNKIIYQNQFGYTKGSNTEIASIHILNDIYLAMDDKKLTALNCLDLSRAFDCVQPELLLRKVKKTEVSSFFSDLLFSYFSKRQQAVRLDNCISTFRDVRNGTPQGGVLSGILFNLYVNSINLVPLYSRLILYCDDISLVSAAEDPISLKNSIEHDLCKLYEWLNYHFLMPNLKKTEYVMFHNRKRNEYFTENSLNITVNGTVIERVECVKLLGLHIDEGLCFSQHINQVISKIVPFTLF
jgi:Reverse transcriptase (RNA-dependent DNA polymerase)